MKNLNLPSLRKRVAKAPTDPGIYRWLDKDGTVLYVGKAKNLRNRLKSYIQKEPDKSLGPWKLALVERIADLDVTVTGTELEALILETNLIKELKPKYNVMMKDGKNYVYVRITTQDPYPFVEIVRRMQEDKAKYFGPFLSMRNIKKTLDMLHVVFRFMACKESIDRLNKQDAVETRHGASLQGKPCLEYQIGRCNGLCVGDITQEQYREAIEEVIRFLHGDHRGAIERLSEKMQQAAENKKFERAVKLRDTLQYIQKLEEEQFVSGTTGENTDVLGVALQSGKAQIVLLKERDGKVIDELSFSLQGQAAATSDVLEQFIPQYYSATEDIPDTIVLGESVEDQKLLEQWLHDRRDKRVEIRIPERGKKSKLLKMAEKNAEEKVKQQFAKWESAAQNIEQALEGLKEILKLPDVPKRIEGYDISHLSGTETVGSMAVMRGGKAANDQYRSFTIRTLKEGKIDDYKALEEVLKRRLRYLVQNLVEEEKQWKKKGIAFGKARKAEQPVIQKIIEDNPHELHPIDVNYKDFLVARKDVDIIGFARLASLKGNILEIKSLWIDEGHRGQHLGQLLIRKLLAKVKKEKVYITIDPSMHEYYAQIGFRHVLSPPQIIQEEIEKAKDIDPGFAKGMAMINLPADRKPDASLNTRPDLLVIDGGKGQLGAALSALKEFNLNIPAIGLAKREEDVFVPKQKAPISFPKDSPAKFLLMRLRDEAHRFANRHREKLGKKKATASMLDEIPGIGEKTKQTLLKEFGSVSEISKASDADLERILTGAQIEAIRRKL